jgi:hypothetical protein
MAEGVELSEGAARIQRLALLSLGDQLALSLLPVARPALTSNVMPSRPFCCGLTNIEFAGADPSVQVLPFHPAMLRAIKM